MILIRFFSFPIAGVLLGTTLVTAAPGMYLRYIILAYLLHENDHNYLKVTYDNNMLQHQLSSKNDLAMALCSFQQLWKLVM